MTLPTITVGVGWQTDCGDKTDWEGTPVLTVESGTVFAIAYSGSNNYVQNKDAAHINISSSTYPNLVFRYKTSNASIKTRVQLVYSDASTEYLTGEIGSLTWATVTATLTGTGKTIDHIRLWANSAVGTVYYDFASLHTSTFTFPDFKTCHIKPDVKIPELSIPSRDTDIQQHLGRKCTVILIECDMKAGETWGSTHLTYGEYLMNILVDRHFQWLTTPGGNFKVLPDPGSWDFIYDANSGKQCIGVFGFKEYDEGNASVFTDATWYGK